MMLYRRMKKKPDILTILLCTLSLGMVMTSYGASVFQKEHPLLVEQTVEKVMSSSPINRLSTGRLFQKS